MRPQDIVNKSDNKSKARAAKQPIRAKLYKLEDSKILYTVTSSEGNKQYIVTIQLLDLTGNRLRSLKSALNGNIRLSCTCPAFLYKGFKFITWRANAGINKETRAPDKTNPNREGMACKHILVALEQMKSDYQAIYNLFKEQSTKSGSDSRQPSDIEDNKDSNVPTEFDIDIITEFKDACDKLYKNYTEWKSKQSDDSSDESFIDSDSYDKVDPSKMLLNLSRPVLKSISGRFIGRIKSVNDILKLIDQKKNGFNILLDSDVKSLIRKLNETVKSSNESVINNIILSLICS